jgi:hypothetical protein
LVAALSTRPTGLNSFVESLPGFLHAFQVFRRPEPDAAERRPERKTEFRQRSFIFNIEQEHQRLAAI